MIGMSCNAIVRNTYSHPYGTFHTRAFAYHLHNPNFIGVGDGEALTRTVITIFLHQVCHHFDGLTGCAAALQTQIYQTAIVYQSCRVYQFGTSAKRRFCDSHLILIDVADDIISLCGLRYLPQELVCVPVTNIHHLSRRMFTCRIVTQMTEHAIRIGRISDQHRTVGRSSLAHDKVRAGKRFHRGGQHECCNHPNFLSHTLLCYLIIIFLNIGAQLSCRDILTKFHPGCASCGKNALTICLTT